MTLVQEAERAEKIRNAFIFFSGPCAHDHNAIQEINKSVSELSSLSCVLREIEKLIEFDTGAGLELIEEDLKNVHEDVTWTLGDIWQSLGRLDRERTPEDCQRTWKEITAQSWKNDGNSLHKTLEGYRRFLESLSKTLNTHVSTPTAGQLRADIEDIHTRRTKPSLKPPATIQLSRQSSSKSVQRVPLSRRTSLKVASPTSPEMRQPKSYERERPMSPDDSSVSSTSDATKIRQKPWAPSPPLSPSDTMSSMSQVSSTARSLDATSSHWACFVFQSVSSTHLPWSIEETRYHEVEGIKEHSYPNQAYESVLTLTYPEGVRVTLFCRPTDYRSKMVVLYRDRRGKQDYGCLPLEDLHLRREGSLLRICRRKSSGKPVPWVSMKFTTFERMILFASTFIAIRSQDSTTQPPPSIHDDEFRDEVCEFAGSIVDSGFSHALRIYRDKISGAIRLQSSVLKGELDRTPVWCSFITHLIQSEGWSRQVDKRTVALTDLKLHIFSARYAPQLSPSGAFMLRFETKDDAESFLEVVEHLRITNGGY